MPVNVIGTLKPKNNGKFPVAEAVDIKVTDDLRLDEALENKADLSTVNFALDNKADKTTTTSLQNQINNIIEPVTEEAEVINAREGADGTSYQTLKARLDAENNDINNSVDNLSDSIFTKTESSVNITDITGVVAKKGWNAAATNIAIEMSQNVLYDTYYFISDDECDIYINGTVAAPYFSICYGGKFTSITESENSIVIYCENGAQRVRNLDNNLPTENNKLHIAKGTAVAFTISANANQSVAGFKIKIVNNNFKNMVIPDEVIASRESENGTVFPSLSQRLSSDYNELNNNTESLKDSIYAEVDTGVSVSAVPGITEKLAYNADGNNVGINFSQLANFNSYYFIADEEYDIYVDQLTASYFAICYGDEYTGEAEVGNMFYLYCENGAQRYRALDNNLPTENNKLHIAKGSAISFTVSSGDTQKIYGLAKSLKIKDSFKEEIISTIPENKTSKLQYIYGPNEGSSNEIVNVFMPAKVGYVKYSFVHTVDATKNADVWRIHNAYATDDNFEDRYAITVSGEWELALHLQGRDDFSGGYSHGDEMMNNVTFIVDGALVDISTVTTLTFFERLEIIQNSDIYDPDDHTTVYAKHGSSHIFDATETDHLSIKQTVIFTDDVTLTDCYMAMFPPSKDTTDSYFDDITYTDTLLTSYPVTIKSARDMSIYSTSVGTKARFSIPQTVTNENLTGGDSLLIHDNGGLGYNKCYYTLCSAGTAKTGDTWKTQTNYNLEITK